MRLSVMIASVALIVASIGAYAQLEPFKDYSISEDLWRITTVRVDPNMGDDYLEGIRDTWVAANEVAKELGQIEDYAIWVSDLPQSGDFNMILAVKFASTADTAPSEAEYDAFIEAWGEARIERNREISKDYPSMREITGEYQMRQITMN